MSVTKKILLFLSVSLLFSSVFCLTGLAGGIDYSAVTEGEQTTFGTWILSESLEGAAISDTDCAFMSGSYFFTAFEKGEGDSPLVYTQDTKVIKAFAKGAWKNEAYRTVTFLAEPGDELSAWLDSNGERAESDEKIVFTAWVMKESLDVFSYCAVDGSFISNGRVFTYYAKKASSLVYSTDEEDIEVYGRGLWQDEGYRTVIFLREPDDTFTNWIKPNADKPGEAETTAVETTAETTETTSEAVTEAPAQKENGKFPVGVAAAVVLVIAVGVFAAVKKKKK